MLQKEKVMLHIKKEKPPEYFDAWIRDKKEYNQQLRGFILENEQGEVCCYCEKSVTAEAGKSHIDHIRPQRKFPKMQHDYNNLVVSCESANSCGQAKGSRFNDDFIVPTEENPADYLTYSLNGEIQAIDGNQKGKETIGILNLNTASLVKARRVMFKQLDQMRKTGDLDAFILSFKQYPTLVEYFKKHYS